MKSSYLLLSLLVLNAANALEPTEPSLDAESQMMGYTDPQNIGVNNRILAKVNGKTISVIDILKRMDVFISRNVPQLQDSKVGRFQFYTTNWKTVLSQMIDTELILADAEGKDLKISEGDVRETLQMRFGPNVMATLDKLGLTFEEARKMIYEEMVVQRMTWVKVNSKAIQNVNPQDIKKAYREFCLKNPSVEEWKYQVLTIRASDSEKNAETAKKAHDLLLSENISLEAVVERLKTATQEDASLSLTVSPDYDVNEKNISKSHKDVLSSLQVNAYSKPLLQVNRVDKSEVFRIFYLKGHKKTEVPPFEQVALKLEEELFQEASNKETGTYLSKLRERLGYDEKHMQESLPRDFQPFSLH